MTEPFAFFAVVAFTFLLAGLVKGAIGMGLPTVAVGLLALAMTPVEAAQLLVIPSLVTNIWQLATGSSFATLARRLWLMMSGIFIGTWVGAGLLSAGSSGGAATALGIALMLYAAIGLATAPLRIPARMEPWLGPVVGATTGLISSTTGVFVIPAVPYLQALGLDKNDLVQALGLSFTISTLSLAIGLASEGIFQISLAAHSLLALGPALAGMAIGQRLRARVPHETFRRWFLFGLLALGGHIALRASL